MMVEFWASRCGQQDSSRWCCFRKMSRRWFASQVRMEAQVFKMTCLTERRKKVLTFVSPARLYIRRLLVFRLNNRERPEGHRSITSASLSRFIQISSLSAPRSPQRLPHLNILPLWCFYLGPRKPRFASSCQIISGDELPRGLANLLEEAPLISQKSKVSSLADYSPRKSPIGKKRGGGL